MNSVADQHVAPTPGALRIVPSPKGLVDVDTDNGACLSVATFWAGWPTAPSAAEALANARAFAAASDLLKALKLFVEDARHYGQRGIPPSSTAFAEAERIIAKAEGREP